MITSIVDTDKDDLRGYVLAENVIVQPTDTWTEVTFDFLCPNCGKRHWAKEFDTNPVFSTVGWALRCGWVSIRMPWAQTPGRDKRHVYGSMEK